jgi:hypothetical protein
MPKYYFSRMTKGVKVRGGQALPKVSPAMHDPSTPCGRATCGRLLGPSIPDAHFVLNQKEQTIKAKSTFLLKLNLGDPMIRQTLNG